MSISTNTADRITVGLCRKVVGEIDLLQSLTGLSKTDIVNRAVTLYAFVTEQTAAGKELLVRDGNTGEVERIRLL